MNANEAREMSLVGAWHTLPPSVLETIVSAARKGKFKCQIDTTKMKYDLVLEIQGKLTVLGYGHNRINNCVIEVTW